MTKDKKDASHEITPLQLAALHNRDNRTQALLEQRNINDAIASMYRAAEKLNVGLQLNNLTKEQILSAAMVLLETYNESVIIKKQEISEFQKKIAQHSKDANNNPFPAAFTGYVKAKAPVARAIGLAHKIMAQNLQLSEMVIDQEKALIPNKPTIQNAIEVIEHKTAQKIKFLKAFEFLGTYLNMFAKQFVNPTAFANIKRQLTISDSQELLTELLGSKQQAKKAAFEKQIAPLVTQRKQLEIEIQPYSDARCKLEEALSQVDLFILFDPTSDFFKNNLLPFLQQIESDRNVDLMRNIREAFAKFLKAIDKDNKITDAAICNILTQYPFRKDWNRAMSIRALMLAISYLHESNTAQMRLELFKAIIRNAKESDEYANKLIKILATNCTPTTRIEFSKLVLSEFLKNPAAFSAGLRAELYEHGFAFRSAAHLNQQCHALVNHRGKNLYKYANKTFVTPESLNSLWKNDRNADLMCKLAIINFNKAQKISNQELQDLWSLMWDLERTHKETLCSERVNRDSNDACKLKLKTQDFTLIAQEMMDKIAKPSSMSFLFANQPDRFKINVGEFEFFISIVYENGTYILFDPELEHGINTFTNCEQFGAYLAAKYHTANCNNLDNVKITHFVAYKLPAQRIENSSPRPSLLSLDLNRPAILFTPDLADRTNTRFSSLPRLLSAPEMLPSANEQSTTLNAMHRSASAPPVTTAMFSASNAPSRTGSTLSTRTSRSSSPETVASMHSDDDIDIAETPKEKVKGKSRQFSKCSIM